MQAIILAAGRGKRLGTLTDSVPKTLVKLNHLTILDRQIEILIKNKIKEIIIITGYKTQSIEKHIKKKYPKRNIKIVLNSKYLELDNLYSVWLSNNIINNDFILLNGDLIFDERLISLIVNYDSCPCLIVDPNVKFDSYSVITKDSVIKKINFDTKKNKPNGQFIGICKFNINNLKIFQNFLKNFHRSNNLDGEYVKIFNSYLEKKISLFSLSTNNFIWFNINNKKNLTLAKEYFGY